MRVRCIYQKEKEVFRRIPAIRPTGSLTNISLQLHLFNFSISHYMLIQKMH